MRKQRADLGHRLDVAALRLSSALHDESVAIFRNDRQIKRVQQRAREAEEEWKNAKAVFRQTSRSCRGERLERALGWVNWLGSPLC
jgi:hypothetical protein